LSKSYRIPCWKDNTSSHGWGKRQAAKSVRRYKGGISKGYSFIKKLYDSWDIHDYKYAELSKSDMFESIDEADHVDKQAGTPWVISIANKSRRSKQIYKSTLFSRKSIRKSEKLK